MRVFLAGATGVIGIRLVPLLTGAGHAVAGMTRSPAKEDKLRALGAEPVVCDVFDADQLTAAVAAFEPDAVMHQLTDLPEDVELLGCYVPRNARIRTEGTRNLVAAAESAGATRLLAQSIAWRPCGRRGALEEHERTVLDAGGIMIRYGQLYGPGTFYEEQPPLPPRVRIGEAAHATVPLLDAQPGVVVIAED
jgi:UDP-glucose 4-epimerase